MPKKKYTGMGQLHKLSANSMSTYANHLASSHMHSDIGDVHTRAADRSARSNPKATNTPGTSHHRRWQHFYESANAHYDESDKHLNASRTLAKSGKKTGTIKPKDSDQAAKFRSQRSNKGQS